MSGFQQTNRENRQNSLTCKDYRVWLAETKEGSKLSQQILDYLVETKVLDEVLAEQMQDLWGLMMEDDDL